MLKGLETCDMATAFYVGLAKPDPGGHVVLVGSDSDLVRLARFGVIAIVLRFLVSPLHPYCMRSTDRAFHAHPFFGANLPNASMTSPPATPSTPPSPSMTRIAVVRTEAHSSSFAYPMTSRRAASASVASSSKAFWKHLRARSSSGGEAEE